jgi:O-antigen/teichoic acid export membrane protein
VQQLAGARAPITFVLTATGTTLSVLVTLTFAKLLGPAQYGIYAYGMAWAMVSVLLVGFGQDKLLLREAAVRTARGDVPGIQALLKWSSGRMLGTSSVVLAAAAVLWLLSSRFESPTLAGVAVALMVVPFIAFTRAGEAVLRARGSMAQGQLGEALLRPGLVLILALIAHFAFGLGTGLSALGLQVGAAVVSSTVIVSLVLSKVSLRHAASVQPELGRQWRTSSVFLSLVGVLQVLNQKLDILILGGLRGAAATGVYAAISPLAALTTFALTVANIAAAPRIAEHYAARDRASLQRVLGQSAAFATGFAILYLGILLALSGTALGVLGPEYRQGLPMLAILGVANLINAASGSVALVLTMTGHEREVAVALCASALLSAALNFVFISLWGAMGAAVASATCMIVWNVALALWGRRLLGVDPTVLSWLLRRGSVPLSTGRET